MICEETDAMTERKTEEFTNAQSIDVRTNRGCSLDRGFAGEFAWLLDRRVRGFPSPAIYRVLSLSKAQGNLVSLTGLHVVRAVLACLCPWTLLPLLRWTKIHIIQRILRDLAGSSGRGFVSIVGCVCSWFCPVSFRSPTAPR